MNGSDNPREAGSVGSSEPSSGEELSLEERLGRLDEIVARLEADDVELDQALALFQEGVQHVRAAEKALSEAELRVEELLGEGAEAETRPIRSEGE